MTRQELRNRAPRFTSAPPARLPQRAPVWPRLIGLSLTIAACVALALAAAHHFGA